MCGEKDVLLDGHLFHPGSPPHVRGKDDRQLILCVCLGITPACAGKSAISAERARRNKDHPRMCGEKYCWTLIACLNWGSPPHVRGKVLATQPQYLILGITPACAGKSLKRSRSTVPPVAIVPLFPSVCNKPVVSDGSPAGRDAPLFLPAENAVPASPAYNLRSL